jgi:hypothetical protein
MGLSAPVRRAVIPAADLVERLVHDLDRHPVPEPGRLQASTVHA